jgi:hypothetical protein
MVVHRDLHVPTGLDEIAGEPDVLARRGWITAGVIVDDDYRRGGQGDRPGDDYADVHGRFVD